MFFPKKKKRERERAWLSCFLACGQDTRINSFLLVSSLTFWATGHSQQNPEFNSCCFFASSVQFSSVIQSCLTLSDLMDCSTPCFPVHHQFLEFTQIHVHQVGDAIQQSHLLSSPSPPTFYLSQHQGLFK